MSQLAQDTEAELQKSVKKTRRKASDQLQWLFKKRKREDEIRDKLVAFAEEMEREVARRQSD